jgi:hypothetical protein
MKNFPPKFLLLQKGLRRFSQGVVGRQMPVYGIEDGLSEDALGSTLRGGKFP